MNHATWRKILGFTSGPENHEFHACDDHKEALDKGDVSCFFAIPRYKIEPYDEANETECYFCRGEEGPAYDKEEY